MTTRILPPEEYGRLLGTELGPAATLLPIGTEIVVVEDRGAIVGCWSLIPYYHCEGVWVAEAHRGKTGVARKLWRGMMALVRSKGVTTVLTGCCSPLVEKLLAHTGAVRLPGSTYVIPVGKD